MVQDIDHRMGAMEFKQRNRDLRCSYCQKRLTQEIARERDRRVWCAVVAALSIVLAIAALWVAVWS
jgi:hypothetical protein